eukprot:6482753-Amphidinium_carterae.1
MKLHKPASQGKKHTHIRAPPDRLTNNVPKIWAMPHVVQGRSFRNSDEGFSPKPPTNKMVRRWRNNGEKDHFL